MNDFNLPTQRQVASHTARFSGWALIGGVGAFVVVFILGWLIFASSVFTSDVRGQGNAVKQKNSGTNRIAAQERFEEMYQDVIAADKRIDVFTKAAAAQPESQVAQTNLTGALTYCQQVVADYNAEARKYTARDFRSLDLPEQIDATDPTTDCEATR